MTEKRPTSKKSAYQKVNLMKTSARAFLVVLCTLNDQNVDVFSKLMFGRLAILLVSLSTKSLWLLTLAIVKAYLHVGLKQSDFAIKFDFVM
jgi:hypothetical protein